MSRRIDKKRIRNSLKLGKKAAEIDNVFGVFFSEVKEVKKNRLTKVISDWGTFVVALSQFRQERDVL